MGGGGEAGRRGERGRVGEGRRKSEGTGSPPSEGSSRPARRLTRGAYRAANPGNARRQ
jgi:hypothetical protein